MKFSGIAFLAANAALASASIVMQGNLMGRDNLPATSAANETEVPHLLHQWNPHEHLNEKRNNDHSKPSPSPWHKPPTDPSQPPKKGDHDPSEPPKKGNHPPNNPPHNLPSPHPHGPSHGPSQWYQHPHGPSKTWGPSQMHHGEKPTSHPQKGDHGSDTPSSGGDGSHDGQDNGDHGKPQPDGPSDGGHDTPSHDGGSDKPTSWPSASARARLPHDHSSFALYGPAAASVCGINVQIPGAEITACPLENGLSGWDCINTAATLESCGGCLSLGEGEDCTIIKGVDKVGCVHGKCVIGSCGEGYWLDSNKMECVAN